MGNHHATQAAKAWLLTALLLGSGEPSLALELSYGGRLTDGAGSPTQGHVDLVFRFYTASTGGSPLIILTKTGVPLTDGIFHVSLEINGSDMQMLFGDGDRSVFVEVQNGAKLYPRQKFSYVPLALRVPVDGSKIVYDAQGRLTLGEAALGDVDLGSRATLALGRYTNAEQATLVSALTLSDKGKTWYNSDTSDVKYFNGTSVVTMGAGGGGSLLGLSGTGGVERLSDGTYATHPLSAAGKALVAASDAAAQRTALSLGSLATRNDIALADLPVSPCAEGRVLRIVAGSWACAQLTAADLNAGVTQAELGYLAGTTSHVQTQLATKLPMSGGAMSGNLSLQGTSELRLADSDSSHFVGFKSPTNLGVNVIYTLPETVGASGQVLSTSSTGLLSWTTLPVASVNNQTGIVTLTTDEVSEGLTRKYFRDSLARASLSASAPLVYDAATGAFALSDTLVKKAGDTLSGSLAMGTHKVTGLGTPTDPADAATKGYSDGSLGGYPLDQTSKAPDSIIKWDSVHQKFVFAADQVGTTGSGIASFNGLSTSSQSLAVSVPGVSGGTKPEWISADSAHALVLPMASNAGVSAGLLSKSDYDAFSAKQPAISSAAVVTAGTVTTALQNGVDIQPFGAGSGATGELRWRELAQGGSDYVGFKAADALAGTVIWTLPAADGQANQVLQTDGTGHLSWAASVAPSGTAGGDLAGTYPSPTVASVGSVSAAAVASGANAANAATELATGSTLVKRDYLGNFAAGTITANLVGAVTGNVSGTAANVTGIVAVDHGGTGLIGVPTAGQIPIGDGTGYTLGTIAAGIGLTVTNSAGAITISATVDPATKVSKSGDTMTGALTLPANGLAVGSDQLVVSGGNVGIGTTTPSQMLTVVGDYSDFPDAKQILIQGKTDPNQNLELGYHTTGEYGAIQAFKQLTGSSPLVLQPAGGNVGIGTTSPASKLHINSGDIIISDADFHRGLIVKNTISATPLYPYLSVQNFKSSTGGSPVINLNNARGSEEAPAALQAQDDLGMVIFSGRNESTNPQAAKIHAFADGDFAGNAIPTSLSFSTGGTSGMVERLRVTSAGNVGIGTATPGATLDVNGTVRATSFISTTGASNFSAQGIQNVSSLAIGTTTAGTDLSFGAGSDRIVSVQPSTTGGNSLTVQAGGTSATSGDVLGGNLVLSSGAAVGTGTSEIHFKTASGGAPATSMTITGSGNVGIGTTTPDHTLSVAGNLGVSGSDWRQLLQVRHSITNGTGSIKWSTSGAFGPPGRHLVISNETPTNVGTGDDGGIVFRTNDTTAANHALPRMVLSQNGNVGIGTTSPAAALDVNGSLKVSGVIDVNGSVKVSGVITEKSVTFTPTTVGWYRIISRGHHSGGTIKISGQYDNAHTDIEFQYYVMGYGQEGSIQETRFAQYNGGFVSHARVSNDGDGHAYLDIYISTAITPGPINLYGYGPELGEFEAAPVVGAVAGSYNVSTLTFGHGLLTTNRVQASSASLQNSDGSVLSTITPGNGNFLAIEAFNATGTVKYPVNLAPWGGNVGIGTTSPAATLDVNGTVRATSFISTTGASNFSSQGINNVSSLAIGTTTAGTDLSFGAGSDRIVSVQPSTTGGNSLTLQAGGTSATSGDVLGGNLVLSSGVAVGTGTSEIHFKTASGGAPATSMTITGSGNVGIGTINPAAMLDLVDSAGLYGLGAQNSAGATMSFGGRWWTGGTNVATLGGIRGWKSFNDGQYGGGVQLLYIPPASSTLTPGVTLDHSGNVGIGTTDPQATLDVNGTVRASSFVSTGGSSDFSAQSINNVSSLSIGTTTAGTDISFGSGADRTMSVQSSATAGNSLTVQAGGTAATTGDVNGGNLVLSSGSASGTGSSRIDLQTANGGAPVTAMTILGNGNVGIGTTSPSHTLQVGSGATDGQQGLTIRGYSNDGAWKGGAAFGSSAASVIMGQLSDVAQIAGHNGTLTAWADLAINGGGGNVGIGTSNPNNTLHVNGTGLIGSTSSGQTNISLNTGGPADTRSISIYYNVADETGRITAAYGGVGHKPLILNADGGNVGIGTTSATGSLQVNVATAPQAPALNLAAGPNPSTAGDGAALTFMHSGNERGARIYERAWSTNVGELRFATGNATSGYDDRVTIANNGNVGIGTTSPAAALHVPAGQIAGGYLASASDTINWHAGNVQSTSAAPGTIAFATGTMINGAAYTLALNNGTGGSYTLSSADITSWKCNPSCSSGQITVGAGLDAVLTIMKMGSVAYVSWVQFQ